MNERSLGLYESINTGKQGKVVKISDGVVWYEIPEFNGWQPCAEWLFFSVMRQVPQC